MGATTNHARATSFPASGGCRDAILRCAKYSVFAWVINGHFFETLNRFHPQVFSDSSSTVSDHHLEFGKLPFILRNVLLILCVCFLVWQISPPRPYSVEILDSGSITSMQLAANAVEPSRDVPPHSKDFDVLQTEGDCRDQPPLVINSKPERWANSYLHELQLLITTVWNLERTLDLAYAKT